LTGASFTVSRSGGSRPGDALLRRISVSSAPRAPLACEIHVPISPTPAFFRSVHILARSLRARGGSLAEARIVVTVGDAERFDLAAAQPWSRDYPIEWRWLEPELWERDTYYATALRRFVGPFAAPLVLMLDADTVLVQPIDDLLLRVEREHALAGLVALGCPFDNYLAAPERWRALFAAAGLGEPALTQEHTNWRAEYGDQPHRLCPPYFNLGMLLAPRSLMTALGAAVFDELPAIDSCGWTRYRCQIAVTLALHRLGLRSFGVERRFNFPNLPDFWDAFPADAAEVRLLHYLDEREVDRVADFADPERFAQLPARTGLHPVNRLLVEAIAA
jgi:hypothetical protein